MSQKISELIQIMPNHADYIWHVWMNRQSMVERDHTPYEFKAMLDWLRYGHLKIEQAFTGTLPKVHKQCSMSEEVPVVQPELRCAIGENVLECKLLASLREVIEEMRQRYPDFSEKDGYRLMSMHCAWHILKKATAMQSGFHLDTSEGYMQDTSDRMYWQNVYSSLAGEQPE